MAFTTLLEKKVQEKHEQKRIFIFGGAREGISTYRFLRATLPDTQLTIVDDKPLEQLGSELQTLQQKDTALRCVMSTEVSISEKEPIIVYKTPGISPQHPFLQKLRDTRAQVTFTSNTDLFLELIHAVPEEDQPHTIGVTGTKGKSTTTAVLAHILMTAEKEVLLAGNIGVPALDLMEKLYFYAQHELHDVYVVLELSSHQLLDITHSLETAVLQDITPEHLDYYASFAEYWQAKARIVQSQTPEDVVLYNPSYALPTQIAATSAARKVPFSLVDYPHQLVKFTQKELRTESGEFLVKQAELKLVGEHNILNILPGVTYALLHQISPSIIHDALCSFEPLPHRLTFVRTVNGVSYYNDSQATTPEAACAALDGFSETGVVLIAGGSDKGVTFELLAEKILSQTVRSVLLFPPMGAQIEAAVLKQAAFQQKKAPRIIPVHSMPEAVTEAQKYAHAGDVVLLSPACASFGLFKNYQDRGNQFTALVQDISATMP